MEESKEPRKEAQPVVGGACTALGPVFAARIRPSLQPYLLVGGAP